MRAPARQWKTKCLLWCKRHLKSMHIRNFPKVPKNVYYEYTAWAARYFGTPKRFSLNAVLSCPYNSNSRS